MRKLWISSLPGYQVSLQLGNSEMQLNLLVFVLWNGFWMAQWKMVLALVWLMYRTLRIRHNQEIRWWVALNIQASSFSDFETQNIKRFQTIDLKEKTHILLTSRMQRKSRTNYAQFFFLDLLFSIFYEKLHSLFNYIQT